MKRKWILSDLDGTLLTSDRRISRTSIERIESFCRRGGHFTFATGRPLSSALPYIEKLEVQVPVILYNGAKLYDPVTKTFLSESHVPEASVAWVLKQYETFSEEDTIDLLVYQNEEIYSPHKTKTVQRFMKKDGVDVRDTSFYTLERDPSRVTKMVFLAKPFVAQAFQNRLRSSLTAQGNTMNVILSEPGILEVLPPEVHKGRACQQLMERTGGTLEQYAAIGDNLNDLEMISLLPNGIAVQNAHPRLKQAASWTTERSHEEDAIVEVIEMWEKTEGENGSVDA